MQQATTDKMIVVMLENIVQQAFPRILSIRIKLERGDVLVGSELDFFIEMLNQMNHCHANFLHDPQCKVVYTTVSHLLNEVVNLAYRNEQAIAQQA